MKGWTWYPRWCGWHQKMIMSWKSKHNKDDDFDSKVVDIAWHEHQSTTKIIIMTTRSLVWHDMNIKYIWHEYQSTTKIIIITTRLLVWLASSFFCCWLALQAPGFGLAGGLGFRFFHQQFFPYASLWKKRSGSLRDTSLNRLRHRRDQHSHEQLVTSRYFQSNNHL